MLMRILNNTQNQAEIVREVELPYSNICFTACYDVKYIFQFHCIINGHYYIKKVGMISFQEKVISFERKEGLLRGAELHYNNDFSVIDFAHLY